MKILISFVRIVSDTQLIMNTIHNIDKSHADLNSLLYHSFKLYPKIYSLVEFL